MPIFSVKSRPTNIFFSVIIAARNETDSIAALLKDLDAQEYKNFEIILVDDHSTDGTAQKITEIIPSLSVQASCIRLLAHEQGKKAAINKGISQAKGTHIVSTDADCRVGKRWLYTFAAYIESKRPKLISAPVTLDFSSTLFEKIQTVEFISLIGSGAVFMYWKKPNMCNGANICYEKASFYEVNGFSGNEQIPSGDDEFLMHKIAALYPNDVRFIKSTDAIVRTRAKTSFRDFFYQRKRWASKWNHYRSRSPIVVAILVFGFHLTFCLLPFLYLSGWIAVGTVLCFVALKMLGEFFFLAPLLRFTVQKNRIWLIPLVSLIHPFYVVFFGLAGNFGNYKWKGRTH